MAAVCLDEKNIYPIQPLKTRLHNYPRGQQGTLSQNPRYTPT